MTRPLAIAALVGSLALAACGSGEPETPTSAPGSSPGEMAGSRQGEEPAREDSPGSKGGGRRAAAGVEITLATSQFGRVLFGEGDRAIYLFDRETSQRPGCYGDCAVAWPPVLTDGRPVARGGVNRELLGTTRRNDGTMQVTYGGHPLYYYVDDPPGEILCHNVEEFGGLWLVLGASGDAVA